MKPSALVGGGRRMERYREARSKRRGLLRERGTRMSPQSFRRQHSAGHRTSRRGSSGRSDSSRAAAGGPRTSEGDHRAGGPLGRRTRFREGCDLSVRPPDSAGGRGCVSSSRPLGFLGTRSQSGLVGTWAGSIPTEVEGLCSSSSGSSPTAAPRSARMVPTGRFARSSLGRCPNLARSCGALGEPKHPVRLLFVMVWVKHQDIWRLELRLAAMPSTGKMGSGHTQTNYPIGSDE